MYLYAWVYLLDTPYSLDRAFEYYIPPELRGNIAKGDLVTVPFGTANRKKLGIVTELSSAPENEKINYHDFEELRFAIEVLGGEYTEERDFSSDKIYKKIKSKKS